jgi:hypothetical protein
MVGFPAQRRVENDLFIDHYSCELCGQKMKNLSWAESKQDLAMAIYALPNDAPRTQPEQELNSILIDRA